MQDRQLEEIESLLDREGHRLYSRFWGVVLRDLNELSDRSEIERGVGVFLARQGGLRTALTRLAGGEPSAAASPLESAPRSSAPAASELDDAVDAPSLAPAARRSSVKVTAGASVKIPSAGPPAAASNKTENVPSGRSVDRVDSPEEPEMAVSWPAVAFWETLPTSGVEISFGIELPRDLATPSDAPRGWELIPVSGHAGRYRFERSRLHGQPVEVTGDASFRCSPRVAWWFEAIGDNLLWRVGASAASRERYELDEAASIDGFMVLRFTAVDGYFDGVIRGLLGRDQVVRSNRITVVTS